MWTYGKYDIARSTRKEIERMRKRHTMFGEELELVDEAETDEFLPAVAVHGQCRQQDQHPGLHFLVLVHHHHQRPWQALHLHKFAQEFLICWWMFYISRGEEMEVKECECILFTHKSIILRVLFWMRLSDDCMRGVRMAGVAPVLTSAITSSPSTIFVVSR